MQVAVACCSLGCLLLQALKQHLVICRVQTNNGYAFSFSKFSHGSGFSLYSHLKTFMELMK